MGMSAGAKKIVEQVKLLGFTPERVTSKELAEAAKRAETRCSWKQFDEYRRADDKDTFDLSGIIGNGAPKAPKKVQTSVNLGSLFVSTPVEPEDGDESEDEEEMVAVQVPKRKLKDKPVDEVREREAERKRKEREDKTPLSFTPSEDPKILDKYTEEVSEEDKATAVPLSRFKNRAARVYVVQDVGVDQYVLGVTKSFDTAWEDLRNKQFNDSGEYVDKEGARRHIDKHGFVVLKSLNSSLKVIIKAMEME